MADRGDARLALDPFHGGKLRNFTRDCRFGLPHRRAERVLREEMFEVGEQQFLMLLFVLDAEFDQRVRRGGQIGQRGLHRGIDMRAPDADVVERRAGQQAALRARVARAFGLIIAVEQIGVAIVERAVARDMVAQDEGFEEPCRVREVPFGGRGIGHRLRAGVGVGQRRDEVERQAAGGGETLREQVGRVGGLRDG